MHLRRPVVSHLCVTEHERASRLHRPNARIVTATGEEEAIISADLHEKLIFSLP